tara:strand:- start:5092 stop:5403 length:312 start_codon:yes stop_codon:yes gene_type:complete
MTPDLFETHPVPVAAFDGADYEAKFDAERLTGQLRKIYDLMKDGNWRSLDEISMRTAAPHASASAQLRNLRKLKFGGHTVDRTRAGDRERGFYKYRLVLETNQ